MLQYFSLTAGGIINPLQIVHILPTGKGEVLNEMDGIYFPPKPLSQCISLTLRFSDGSTEILEGDDLERFLVFLEDHYVADIDISDVIVARREQKK